MAMGTNRFGARIREAKSTIGPSAPPIVAIDAASLAGRPNTSIPSSSAAKVPASANRATTMLAQGGAE
jgi:hypothetical protein